MSGAAIRDRRWPWLGRGQDEPAPGAAPPPPARPGTAAKQRLYDEVGDFLLTHALTLDERNFAVVLAYANGVPAVVGQVAALVRAGTVDDAAMRAVTGVPRDGLDPKFLEEMVRRMTAKLSQCLEIVRESNAATELCEAAAELGAVEFEADPRGSFDRLLGLTRSVLAATRSMERRLDTTHCEAERLRANLERARREADRDHLTGLPNRRSFDARLDAWRTDAPEARQGCVAICDLDDFKAVNDRHGHPVGDRVLRAIARSLRKGLAGHATVARYGGEEFVCLFEATPPDRAAQLLDSVRARLGTRRLANHDNGAPIGTITFSAGLAAIGGDPHQALRAADEALYRAKRLGKDRVELAPG